MPRQAPLHITADQQYMLYVNGVYAGRGPARGFQVQWPYDTIDLSALLKKGQNWLSVVVYNAGVSTFQYLHEGWAGFLCAGKWGKTEIVSNADWRCRIDPSHREYTARLSMQLNFQEQVLGDADDRRWITNSRVNLTSWQTPTTRVFGSMPWHRVEPRQLPNLACEVWPYQAAVASAAGRCDKGWGTAHNLATLWAGERQKLTTWSSPDAGKHVGLSSRLGSQREAESLEVTVPAAGRNGFQAVVLDLGRMGVGTWLLEASGGCGGEVVDLFASETREEDGGPRVSDPSTGRGCWASMAARLTLRPGPTCFETFQMLGHRYVTLIVRDSTQPLRIRLALRHCVYPMKDAGRFQTTDATIQGIFETCRATQRVCALDTYVDTSWREQTQWWGDARVQGWNTFHLCGDDRLLERGIRQIAMQRVPNGLTYGHTPTMAHQCILPDFTLIWMLTFYDHYWQTGTPRLFSELWHEIEKALGYFDHEAPRRDGLLAYDPRYWLFLDWTDLHKTGVPTLYNLWYVHTLERLLQLASVTCNVAAERFLQPRYQTMRRLVIEQLYDRPRQLFIDGLDDKGKVVPTASIHNQTLSIMAGLCPEAHPTMREQVLLPYLRRQDIEGAMPSSYWVTYIYQVMREAGEDAAVLDHMVEYWKRMTPFGGCTETFIIGTDGQPEPHDEFEWTFSHAWSAHPIYHLMGSLGGITQIAPGWTKVRFRPLLGVSNSVKAVYPTPLGDVVANCRRLSGKRWDIRLALPDQMQAQVDLPGISSLTCQGRQRWQIEV